MDVPQDECLRGVLNSGAFDTVTAALLTEIWSDMKKQDQRMALLGSVVAATAAFVAENVPEPPAKPAVRFDLSQISDSDVIRYFLFDRDEIELLVKQFGLPEPMIFRRHRFGRVEALCVLLRYLHEPIKFDSMRDLFGRAESELSACYRGVLSYLLLRYGRLLFFDSVRLDTSFARLCAHALQRRFDAFVASAFCAGFRLLRPVSL